MPAINSKLVQALVERLMGAKGENTIARGGGGGSPIVNPAGQQIGAIPGEQAAGANLMQARQDLQAAQPIDPLAVKRPGSNLRPERVPGIAQDRANLDASAARRESFKGATEDRLSKAGGASEADRIEARELSPFRENPEEIRSATKLGRGSDATSEVVTTMMQQLLRDFQDNAPIATVMRRIEELRKLNPKLADEMLDRFLKREEIPF